MRFLAALGRVQETRRYLGPFERGEEVVPGRRFTRQDHITGFWILANKNLLGIEAVGCRQAYRLATAIGEQSGDLADGLSSWRYSMIYPESTRTRTNRLPRGEIGILLTK